MAVMGRLFGVASCGPEPLAPIGLGGDCAGLVASMALRVGIASGVATVVLALLSAGLLATAARLDEQRRAAGRFREGAADE